MMSPKAIARWQELKAKKLSGRTVPENMEYKKLQMKHDADVLALNELKWKAELAEAIMLSSMNNEQTQTILNDVIHDEISDNQKPYSQQDIDDFVADFQSKVKQENEKQNHKEPLKNNPLENNDYLNGEKEK